MADPHEVPNPPLSSLSGCLFQLIWSMLAPGFVLIAGALCVLNHPPIGSREDWFLLAAVVVAVCARFLDPSPAGITGPEGETPVSPRKYAAWMAAAGGLLFVIAHFVIPSVL